MYNRILYLSLFFIFVSLKSISQEIKLSDDEATSLMKSIIQTSENTNTIVSDFVQLKHLSFLSKDIKSSGRLVFKGPDLIKWEYQTPFKYSVIFKQNELLINDNGTKSNIDLSASKEFKSLNKLIIQSVKGDMFDSNRFDIICFKLEADYVISFTSIEKQLKSIISKFELTFDGKSYHVKKIKMIENKEDYTTIKFINQKINEAVSDAIFIN